MDIYYWASMALTNFMLIIAGLLMHDLTLAACSALMMVWCLYEFGKRTGLL